jgi:histidinol-phosphate aminotransferase
VLTWRAWLAQQLGGLGLDVTPSQANFVLVGFPENAGQDGPRGRGLSGEKRLYRPRRGNYGLPDHLRITIGREAHNRAVIDILTEFFKA